MQVVKGTESPKLAQGIRQLFFKTGSSKGFCRRRNWFCTNKIKMWKSLRNIAKVMPYGEEAVNSLVDLNWEVANNNKDDWTDRWNKNDQPVIALRAVAGAALSNIVRR